jgi:hypothetical protein
MLFGSSNIGNLDDISGFHPDIDQTLREPFTSYISTPF